VRWRCSGFNLIAVTSFYFKRALKNKSVYFVTLLYNREAFKTADEFLHWYNDLIAHKALDFDKLETPSQAFKRKLKK